MAKTTYLKEIGVRAIVALALLLSGCDGSAPGSDPEIAANPYEGYVSQQYGGTDHWLCHPQLAAAENVCLGKLDATVVEADGASAVQAFRAAPEPAVDCFYLYPTTSDDPGLNSDFNPDAQENQTTLMQAGRYGQVCRLFAPVYRQLTLTSQVLNSVPGAVTDEQLAQAKEIAYGDVLDAFREYIAHHNAGRGFLLLGHSQGAKLAVRLIAEEIERSPYLAQHLIAAHIPGAVVAVPDGRDTGGTFASTPPCRTAMQNDCVIAYSSYRAGDSHLDDPHFGVTGVPGTHAMCVNPAALAGGESVLDAYLPYVLPPVYQALLIPRGTLGPFANMATNLSTALQTPFFSVPGQISAECVVNAVGASYLEIRIAADPDDPRADDYAGEFIAGTDWGLHLIDVNLPQGDLVRLAHSESEAWLKH